MSYHTDEDRLKVAATFAEKVIVFSNRCRNDEFKDENVRCYELSLLADMARQITDDYEK